MKDASPDCWSCDSSRWRPSDIGDPLEAYAGLVDLEIFRSADAELFGWFQRRTICRMRASIGLKIKSFREFTSAKTATDGGRSNGGHAGLGRDWNLFAGNLSNPWRVNSSFPLSFRAAFGQYGLGLPLPRRLVPYVFVKRSGRRPDERSSR